MYKCKSPILLIGFNRPDCLQTVIESLREVKPENIYVAIDGPRNAKEKIEVEKTKEVVKGIDWECNIKTRYQEKNLGCKLGVSTAIDWVFQNEEFAIIIEDDIIARPEFFQLCDNLSSKYANNDQIYMISGTNYYPDTEHKNAYIYTQNYTIWGWATWKRCWRNYDVTMSGWSDTQIKDTIQSNSLSWFQWQYWKRNLDLLNTNYMDTWDIQWVYHCIVNRGLAITTTTNLVTNIGVDGAHSKSLTDSHFMATQALNLEKGGPSSNLVDHRYDKMMVNKKYIKLILLEMIRKPLRPYYRYIRRLLKAR